MKQVVSNEQKEVAQFHRRFSGIFFVKLVTPDELEQFKP
jgi:hypothetical protein